MAQTFNYMCLDSVPFLKENTGMCHKNRFLFVIVVLTLFVSGSLYAQTPQDLRFGVMTPGNLTRGGEQWYRVRPTEAGIVVVETSGDLDTILEVYDDSKNSINSNDDGGEDVNARLELVVEAGKTYLFMLTGYDDSEMGPYRIMASFESLAADTTRNTERARAVPIRLGESFPVIFYTPSESRWFSFNIPRDGTMFAVQTRGRLDTVLLLYDARGNLITEDDDSGEDYNAHISQRLSTGTVYIEVKEYDSMTGRCTLHAETR